MGELRREFLNQTISNLRLLRREAIGQTPLSDDYLRRAFRQLHTIKGTSRTFNLENLAHFAHQCENLLQAIQTGQVTQTAETTDVFKDGLLHLSEIAECFLTETEISHSDRLLERMKLLLPDRINGTADLLAHHVPARYLAQLSGPEKENLGAALQRGCVFYLVEVFFAFAGFDLGFRNFREILSQNGEVAAIAPAAAESSGQIGFRIYFAGRLTRPELDTLISGFSARITFENSPIARNMAGDLNAFLANLVSDGEKLARMLDKEISFETVDRTSGNGYKHLILLNEIASHLLHNAIDHGIESPAERLSSGKGPTARINIRLAINGDKLLLQITDDGRGIDSEKIRRQAQARGFVAADRTLEPDEILQVIFNHGFTTSETISEISGRGVGLDAVRDLVEKAGGEIGIETDFGSGTSFLIYLPLN